MPERADAVLLRDALVPWFRAHARLLPWRSDPTPYHVLLSELMLQQTRVDTVLPYFAKFVARWPTIEALAAAEPDEVLSAWAGLGYYRRARLLHAAAGAAVAAGGLPPDVDGLLALPGIGPYTAGAIASIAFGVPAVAVDGNVERVISRVDARDTDPRSTVGKRALAARVAELTAPGVASEVTQGLMELGATVCTPRNPRCGACPWVDACLAARQDRATEFPKLPPRLKPVPVRGVAVWLTDAHGRVLCGRRPPGLLGGLWEPVGGEVGEGEDAAEVAPAVLAARTGHAVTVGAPLGRVVHVFTHRRLTVEVFAGTTAGPVLAADAGGYEALDWVDPEAPHVPLSKLGHRLVAVGRESGRDVAIGLPFPSSAE